MKHTQGKWSVKQSPMLSDRHRFSVVINGDKKVCGCGNNKANANLIASAPEMLKMLKKLHESCLNHRGKKRRKLGELIAKAEGGE